MQSVVDALSIFATVVAAVLAIERIYLAAKDQLRDVNDTPRHRRNRRPGRQKPL